MVIEGKCSLEVQLIYQHGERALTACTCVYQAAKSAAVPQRTTEVSCSQLFQVIFSFTLKNDSRVSNSSGATGSVWVLCEGAGFSRVTAEPSVLQNR